MKKATVLGHIYYSSSVPMMDRSSGTKILFEMLRLLIFTNIYFVDCAIGIGSEAGEKRRAVWEAP